VTHRYQPYYCEENVWHLAGESALAGLEPAALFISNAERSVALWEQRAGRPADGLVIWDYHVVLLARAEPGDWKVWDLDTRLGLPVTVDEWLGRTFRPLPAGLTGYAPRFRIVEGEAYRAEFSSDRAHMRSDDGAWTQPPPPWPPIERPGTSSFLRWTVMADGDDSMTMAELRAYLSSRCAGAS
jgi:protein N-terminal glutamine amidohydrolase